MASRSESEKDHEYYSQMAEGKAGMMQESKNILALKSSGEQGCFRSSLKQEVLKINNVNTKLLGKWYPQARAMRRGYSVNTWFLEN